METTKATFPQASQVLKLIDDQNPTSEQLQELIGSGIFCDYFEAKRRGKKITRKMQRKAFGLEVIQSQKILEIVGTIVIPAMTEKFIAKEKFIVDTGKKAKVKIVYLSDNFEKFFLDKIEESIVKTTLCSNKLLVSSVDDPIISELGGEEKIETKLSHVFHLISQQPNGEKGVLLVNGWANIFYVRDKNGNFCAVNAYWYGDGWYLYADSVGRPSRWRDGRCVFSPQILES